MKKETHNRLSALEEKTGSLLPPVFIVVSYGSDLSVEIEPGKPPRYLEHGQPSPWPELQAAVEDEK